MSYYETYEFLAVDRPLTPVAMRALLGLSTRATITPTRFYNFYDWGGLKGDPREMVYRYFDVFVYTGAGGARWGMLRFPTDRIDVRRWRTYLPEQRGVSSPKWGASFVRRGAVTLLTFAPPDATEIAEDETLDDEGGWAAPLALLRADLLAGDVRGLYLAWLSLGQGGERRQGDRGPSRPVGLTPLTGTLHAFAEFLHLDPDLLKAAAPKLRGRRRAAGR